MDVLKNEVARLQALRRLDILDCERQGSKARIGLDEDETANCCAELFFESAVVLGNPLS